LVQIWFVISVQSFKGLIQGSAALSVPFDVTRLVEDDQGRGLTVAQQYVPGCELVGFTKCAAAIPKPPSH
ncbi:MAG: hypothetical protein KJZ94_07345, partial [Ignavibacteria bacterium]|nr:hypothetical protein [Ignavibacteria bacterium]